MCMEKKEKKKRKVKRKICVWDNEKEWLKKKKEEKERKRNAKKDMRGMNQVKEK
jgi:hypothetical protein